MCSQIIKTEPQLSLGEKKDLHRQFQPKLILINTIWLFKRDVVRTEMLFRSFMTEELQEAPSKPSCAVAVTGFAFQYPK